MATDPSVAGVRRGHSLDGGRILPGNSRIRDEDEDEDDVPFCVSRSVRRSEGGALGSSTGLNSSANRSGAGGRSEEGADGKKGVEVGAEKKRVLGNGRPGSSVGGSRLPLTKKLKLGSEGMAEAKKREPDPDAEDEDEVPLAQRRSAVKKALSPPSPAPTTTSRLIAAKKLMDAKKAAKAEGNSLASASKPASDERADRIVGDGSASREQNRVEGSDSEDEQPLSHRKSLNVSSRDPKAMVKDSVVKKRPAGTTPSTDLPPVKKLKVVNSPKPEPVGSSKSTGKQSVPVQTPVREDNEDDEDDVPLARRMPSGSASKKTTTASASTVNAPDRHSDDEDDDNVPLAQRKAASTPPSKSKVLAPVKKPSPSSVKSMTKKVLEQRKKMKMTTKIVKKDTKETTTTTTRKPAASKQPISGGGQKWDTLEHNGVVFPPPYQPHGVKMLYKGKPVDLSPEQEEVATMFAVMKDTDYATKPKFIENFWNDWKPLLGSKHVIKDFENCDFTPIYDWFQREKEKKKLLTGEEKKRLKEEKLKAEEKYTYAVVNGVKEKIGNFRVEPPGLFRGRGEHPKMGKLKTRIFPEHIVINIGRDAPVPECPMPGHNWKEIRHDNTVTWLAFWNDPINNKEFKYVFLSPSSSLKGQSDLEKYEKARRLKDYIDNIRQTYTKQLSSQDMSKRQIAVAMYLIDRLALRAGNEKDEDEADTVGCCSLKVEHVTTVPPKSLQFDFLGKDSIRYFNTVEVEEKVFIAVQDFKKGKRQGEDLFDKLDTTKLNTHLKDIMPGLTAKVFRTYNASITLDTLLQDTVGNNSTEKSADYQRANKEVAILCNHQRSVSKAHSSQMEKLETKLQEVKELVAELKVDLERAKKGKPPLKDDGKKRPSPETLEKKIQQSEQRIEKMQHDMLMKDDMKTVALGTSKINYMDPRISVAWCKRHEVPIEKIFNKSLLAKFAWAMDVDPEYRF